MKVGGSSQLVFSGYYTSTANRSVSMLQMIIEGTSDYDAGSVDTMRNTRVQSFDFEGLVAAFDAARVANPSMTSWALTNSLLVEHLGGSDSAAIGGDLTYRYGRFGNLTDVSFTPALGLLAASEFGTSAQNLQSTGALFDGSMRLS